MSGSNLQGWWMPSSVTEEDIKKLREARYLTAEISHRLPLFGEPVRDVVRQVSGLPQLFDMSLHDGGGHPPASRSEPDIVEDRKYPNLEPWVLELGARGGFDRGLKKRNGPWSHYKEGEYQEPSP